VSNANSKLEQTDLTVIMQEKQFETSHQSTCKEAVKIYQGLL
jgi:hypothetical protein